MFKPKSSEKFGEDSNLVSKNYLCLVKFSKKNYSKLNFYKNNFNLFTIIHI